MSCLSLHWVNDLPGEKFCSLLLSQCTHDRSPTQVPSFKFVGHCERTESLLDRCLAGTPFSNYGNLIPISLEP